MDLHKIMAALHSIRNINELEPGDHVCCLFETDDEHRALMTSFMRRGLEQNEKVIYIVDTRSANEVINYLRDNGVETESCLESGQLIIFTIGDAYMREGIFDPDNMIALLQDQTEQALNEGYSALRVTGEMTWALRDLSSPGRLIEYEAKLNTFFPGSKCLAICQYDRRRFSATSLLDIFTNHPIACVGREVFDNFYYVPPMDFLGSNRDARMLDNWLDNLKRQKSSEKALKAREEVLQFKTSNLEEMNTALKVMLNKRDEDRKELEEKVLLNMKWLVLPYLNKMKKSGLNEKQETYRDIVESLLNEITSPFVRKLSSQELNFTPTQIQVANLVKEGKTTKEIAELLNSSTRAVEFHRENVRARLDLKNLNPSFYLVLYWYFFEVYPSPPDRL
jgi:DNA-binding CsgD family transcriptional regulator